MTAAMLLSLLAPLTRAFIPEPYELYGVAKHDTGVVLDDGSPIRSFVDGVDYSNKTSVFSRPANTDGYFDIDTYGNPWDHWVALLPNVSARMLVFLTVGSYGGLGRLSKTALRVLGLASIHVPPVIQPRLLDRSINACLALPLKRGLSVTVWTTKASKNAQYFAALVEPRA